MVGGGVPGCAREPKKRNATRQVKIVFARRAVQRLGRRSSGVDVDRLYYLPDVASVASVVIIMAGRQGIVREGRIVLPVGSGQTMDV